MASDSVLLHKKGETGRLSHSYEDTDTRSITAHYAGRRTSKAQYMPGTDGDTQVGSTSGTYNLRIFDFNYFHVHQMLLNNQFHLLNQHQEFLKNPNVPPLVKQIQIQIQIVVNHYFDHHHHVMLYQNFRLSENNQHVFLCHH